MLPKSLNEASNILIQRRDEIIANGCQPKYSDAELAYLAKHGNVGGERFQVRFMESRFLNHSDTPETPLSDSMGGATETESGSGVKYWTTSFDQLEDADSDPKLIAEKLGLGFDPAKTYVLIIVASHKSAPVTGVKSVPETFEKLGQFANKELPKAYPKSLTDQIMTPYFQAKYAENYYAAVKSGEIALWSRNIDGFKTFLSTTTLGEGEKSLLVSRMEMHERIGNNQDYRGSGLTKNNNPTTTSRGWCLPRSKPVLVP